MPRITYLVSGDTNILPSHQNLRRTGRHVRHDNDVGADAAAVLKASSRYVVIAHGNSQGTVKWFWSASQTSAEWLWVGMPTPPSGPRVYLYACRAGKRLPRFLRHCECFGHTGDVPMPIDGARDVVLDFLDQVDRLMGQPQFDATLWRKTLGKYVNGLYVEEVENPTEILKGNVLLALRDSLGNVDD